MPQPILRQSREDGVGKQVTKETWFPEGSERPGAFNRCYYLTFTDPFVRPSANAFGPDGKIINESIFDNRVYNKPDKNYQLILAQSRGRMGLAIDFTVDKYIVEKDKKSKNRMVLKIFNLSLENQTKITRGDIVNFEVGYNNDLALIFYGVVDRISASTNGCDRITQITCTEMPAVNPSLVRGSLSVAKGTPVKKLAEDFCRMLIRVLPTISSWDLSAFNTSDVLSKPYLIIGNVADKLTDLLDMYNMRWHLFNGTIVAISNLGKQTVQITEIAPENGLIGSPKMISKKQGNSSKKKDVKREVPGFQITTLLNNRLSLNDWVNVQTNPGRENPLSNGWNVDPSETLRTLKIEQLQFKGNSYTGDFLSIIKAYERPQPNVEIIEKKKWRRY